MKLELEVNAGPNAERNIEDDDVQKYNGYRVMGLSSQGRVLVVAAIKVEEGGDIHVDDEDLMDVMQSLRSVRDGIHRNLITSEVPMPPKPR